MLDGIELKTGFASVHCQNAFHFTVSIANKRSDAAQKCDDFTPPVAPAVVKLQITWADVDGKAAQKFLGSLFDLLNRFRVQVRKRQRCAVFRNFNGRDVASFETII